MSAPLRRRRRSLASAIPFDNPGRWGVACVLALLSAVALFTGFRIWQAIHKVDPTAGLGAIVGLAGSGENTPGSLAYKIKHGDRVNILMLGYGGVGHDGGYLTDSIMVISIQGPSRVAFTSVPRDTFVNLSRGFAGQQTYYNKMNVAYEIPLLNGALGKVKPEYDKGFAGAGALASQVIGDYIGVPIDYWVGVDFTAFKKVVDAVGGIDVVNPYTLDDDQYPLGETTGYTHIHFDKGPLHLDGDHALIYVRERHADSDFGRSRRQQQALAAIKEKALSVGAIPKMFTLLDALQDNVKTNMAIGDLKTFAAQANRISTSTAHHVSIDNSNFQYDAYSNDGAYILLPRDHTLSTLHQFIQNDLPDPAMLGEKANVQFASSFAEASEGYSLAGIWTGLGKMLSLQMTPPDSVSHAPATTEVHDYSQGRATKTAAWLAKYFNGTVIADVTRPSTSSSTAPTAAPSDLSASAPDVVVVIGSDFAAQFNNAEAPSSRPVYVPLPPNPSPRASRPSPSPSDQFTDSPTPTPFLRPSPPALCQPPLCRAKPSPTPDGGPSPSPPPPSPRPTPHPSPS